MGGGAVCVEGAEINLGLLLWLVTKLQITTFLVLYQSRQPDYPKQLLINKVFIEIQHAKKSPKLK